ncbi:DMT family transporter [Stutzerimonas kunmingensis]|uniref:DMT family transporter n=1 Tax=Stutzerimonas kunmingensis TaxID=1211807 RepID=UPI001E440A65|nr:multidrug efflux SMR transporter [Stutzerimonas kunmingensis]MCB4796123.1 multidrug efflux SMR transporter [Pseudomonas sp. NP21570]WOF79243.1 multidrug efflux SMR transporter [Pseudomonas sp. FeN3W]HBO6206964.1 multidrug efflux SMR transporter [Pseudomonas aeruginosa]HCG1306213.1 multidrug efflux SMR transporter [Pseudomonas aeruginosa]HCG1307156.1 multidrug efflux SMR transporter [Pseudomonas aeruginosa]
MSSQFIAFGALALAIVSEVAGSTLLQKTEQFTRPLPTVAMALCFAASLYFLSHALKVIPLGIAYAIWAGLGIVLTAIVSVVVYRTGLDGWAMFAIGLIVAGVVIMNTLSTSGGH